TEILEKTTDSVQSTTNADQNTTYGIQSTTQIIEKTTNSAQSTMYADQDTTYDMELTTNKALETTYGIEQTTEIAQETTDSVQTTTEILEDTTGNVQLTTNADQETTYDMQSTTETMQETSDNVQSTTNAGQDTTYGIQSTTQIMHKTTDSTQSSINAAQETSYPVETTIEDAYTTTDIEEESTIMMETTKYVQTTINQTTTPFIEGQSSTSTIMISPRMLQIPVVNQDCSPARITLIPGRSTLLAPEQFRRNQDFYISSNIQLNCNTSLSTILQWTINNCSSTDCSSEIQIDQTIPTTLSELYIPARTLSYGIYELTLTVTIVASSNEISSASVYIQINPSGITANLVKFGTSMITRGHQQDLSFNPGTFSVDPNGLSFNAFDWTYEYYCRIYGLYNFPNIQGTLLPIDDPRIDPSNPACISNRTDNRKSWQYNGANDSLKSSVTILSDSLLSNRTYQFMVYMENRQNSLIQTTGYVLVNVVDTQPQMIVIACVISTMCVPNIEFQLLNPTTQVALYSICIGNCSSLINITWNIYQGFNASLSTVQWISLNQSIQYENNWLYGTNTSNFTALNQLFINNPNIFYWRFEVVYSFPSLKTSSALNFVINQPPQNGSCSISPQNGTTSTLFTISCSNWLDEDGIQDYSLYSYSTDSSKKVMIAFSTLSRFQVRLSSQNDNISIVNLFIYISDTFDCITEFNISSIIVTTDSSDITNLINALQSPTTGLLINNPIIQLLSTGNQNTVGQILSSLSQQLNKINADALGNAISNGISATSISISPLGSQTLPVLTVPFNESALTEYKKQLNLYANLRDYLMSFTTNLVISTSDSIILQASTLTQLTQSTNQLTRSSATIASNKCYQLAQALYTVSTQTSYEDVQTAANQIAQCTSNVLTAINGPLQGRTLILDLDSSRANTIPQDYDTDLESGWSNLSMITSF
ncbi:unnamed protein product, partial [Adineta steineri]